MHRTTILSIRHFSFRIHCTYTVPTIEFSQHITISKKEKTSRRQKSSRCFEERKKKENHLMKMKLDLLLVTVYIAVLSPPSSLFFEKNGSGSAVAAAATEIIIDGPGLSMRPNQGEYGILYPMLGKNDLSEVEYKYDLHVDDNCDYELIVNYKLNPNFPVGSASTCLPSEIAEYDGNSMLEGRWFYEEFPEYVEDAIDVNHISLDYNPCGHPGPGFLVPHFDAHIYRVSPTYRVHDMNCEVIAGTPACWQDQFIEEGQKFFNLDYATDGVHLRNIPEGFHFAPEDVVIHMGSHIFETPPSTPEEWIDPAYILGTYDANVIFFEPMLPSHYIMGDTDQFYERDIVSVEKNDQTLPDYYSIIFDSNTQMIAMTFKGQSNICQEEFDQQKQEYESMIANLKGTSGGFGGVGNIMVVVSTFLLSATATLLF